VPDLTQLTAEYQHALETHREALEAQKLANALVDAREEQLQAAWEALIALWPDLTFDPPWKDRT
jgi:hypothetical protein